MSQIWLFRNDYSHDKLKFNIILAIKYAMSSPETEKNLFYGW